MSEQFSSQLSQWLSRYRTFIGSGSIAADPLSGRALGPASGALWEAFPFQAPSAFSGLFAGMSFSGMDPSIESVRLAEYRSRRGFRPVSEGPFSGDGWQNMTGEDWSKLDPTVYAPIAGIPVSVHAIDLRFKLGETEYSTFDSAWTYRERTLSSRYSLHLWAHGEGLVVTAVCFTSVSETNRPFLRPCYVSDPGAEIDPVCLFPHRRMAQLFGGLTVLTAGEEITLHAAEQADPLDDRGSLQTDESLSSVSAATTVTIAKKPSSRSAVIRSLAGVSGDPAGNLSFSSTGSHRITRRYSEIDTEADRITLEPHTLYIASRDEPCCSCDDYVADYERVRELHAEQEELVRKYNETYEKLRLFRDDLKERVERRAKLIRIRMEKTERKEPKIRCEFTLIYTNVRREEFEHRKTTIQLSSENGRLALESVKVIQLPRDTEFEVLSFNDSSIEVSSIRSPGLTHLAVRLEAILSGPMTDDFEFVVLPERNE